MEERAERPESGMFRGGDTKLGVDSAIARVAERCELFYAGLEANHLLFERMSDDELTRDGAREIARSVLTALRQNADAEIDALLDTLEGIRIA